MLGSNASRSVFARIGTNIENATETAENRGEQAGTMLLVAAVIVLPIAAMLQLIVCCGTQECHSSFALCNVPRPPLGY